ncbi:MAG: hypothetical protein LBU11_13270 [Zoogloeaceae bacterium]|jgi:hypothetical protein|nr:hypothetical protein [Zoogloeaceae bacterium]
MPAHLLSEASGGAETLALDFANLADVLAYVATAAGWVVGDTNPRTQMQDDNTLALTPPGGNTLYLIADQGSWEVCCSNWYSLGSRIYDLLGYDELSEKLVGNIQDGNAWSEGLSRGELLEVERAARTNYRNPTAFPEAAPALRKYGATILDKMRDNLAADKTLDDGLTDEEMTTVVMAQDTTWLYFNLYSLLSASLQGKLLQIVMLGADVSILTSAEKTELRTKFVAAAGTNFITQSDLTHENTDGQGFLSLPQGVQDKIIAALDAYDPDAPTSWTDNLTDAELAAALAAFGLDWDTGDLPQKEMQEISTLGNDTNEEGLAANPNARRRWRVVIDETSLLLAVECLNQREKDPETGEVKGEVLDDVFDVLFAWGCLLRPDARKEPFFLNRQQDWDLYVDDGAPPGYGEPFIARRLSWLEVALPRNWGTCWYGDASGAPGEIIVHPVVVFDMEDEARARAYRGVLPFLEMCVSQLDGTTASGTQVSQNRYLFNRFPMWDGDEPLRGGFVLRTTNLPFKSLA